MHEEQWAEIEGFPNYAISNKGRVINLKRNQYLSPRVNSYGKLRVVLYREGERFDLYVHRLLARAFLTAYEEGTFVYHNDKDGQNNIPENLVLPSGHKRGLLKSHPSDPGSRWVIINEAGERFRNVGALAQFLRTDPTCIFRVLRGERRSHLGYTFEFQEGH